MFYIELSFGMGEYVLQKAKFLDDDISTGYYGPETDPLLPENSKPWRITHSRFRYHPLLQATPIPNFFRPGPPSIHHDSQGFRGSERRHGLAETANHHCISEDLRLMT